MGYLDKALEAMQKQGDQVIEPIRGEPIPSIKIKTLQGSNGELIKSSLDKPDRCKYCGAPIVFVKVVDWFESTDKIRWATLSTEFTSFHRCVKYDFIKKDE